MHPIDSPDRHRFNRRVASAADVPALARLINRAYRVEDFFIDGDRTSEADVRARIAKPDSAFLVVEDARALAGCVYLELRGPRGYFGMLSIDPTRQGRGLARSLVTAVEDHCRAAGCRFLDLDVVNLREELPAFYARLGFTPTGLTAPFPDPQKLRQPAHLVMMSKGI
jgi:GNAT superfamily N-acetyltransferase